MHKENLIHKRHGGLWWEVITEQMGTRWAGREMLHCAYFYSFWFRNHVCIAYLKMTFEKQNRLQYGPRTWV